MHGNGLARTVTVLGYGRRGWPTAIAACLRPARLALRASDVGTGWTTGRTANGTGKIQAIGAQNVYYTCSLSHLFSKIS